MLPPSVHGAHHGSPLPGRHEVAVRTRAALCWSHGSVACGPQETPCPGTPRWPSPRRRAPRARPRGRGADLRPRRAHERRDAARGWARGPALRRQHHAHRGSRAPRPALARGPRWGRQGTLDPCRRGLRTPSPSGHAPGPGGRRASTSGTRPGPRRRRHLRAYRGRAAPPRRRPRGPAPPILAQLVRLRAPGAQVRSAERMVDAGCKHGGRV